MNHVNSPDTSDAGIEQRLQKTSTAPRVTPHDLNTTIVDTVFFTAAQACDASGTCDPSMRSYDSLKLLTFCVLVLRNGFTVTGESACASPENFNAQIGRDIALANAKEKMWSLLGYALKDKLWQEQNRDR